jgi:hypothetical protein
MHDYVPAADLLGFYSLAERRRTPGIEFINGLSNGNIDSSDIISLLRFQEPSGLQESPLYSKFLIPP